ncbi:MAG: hypothetical protein FWD13_03890 [Treponema sp.]|nr:hypothetical protein [Treponema sp.]
MKKNIIFILVFFILFTLGFSPSGNNALFAQIKREALIYIPPITGTNDKEESTYFHQILTYEAILQYFNIVRSQNRSEFILKGSIISLDEYNRNIDELYDIERQVTVSPVPSLPTPPVRNTRDRREFFSWEVDDAIYFFDTKGEDNYEPIPQLQNQNRQPLNPEIGNSVLILELIHTKDNTVFARRHLFYLYQDNDTGLNEALTIIVREMLSYLPEIEEIRDSRSNWLFLEASALWTPRLYSNEGNSLYLANFGGRLALDFQLFDFMSLSIGAQVTQDWFVVTGNEGDDNRDLILEFPLALKFIIKPGNNLMLEPYGGISYNYSYLETTQPSIFSWFAGLQIGTKAGPGILFIDGRFSMDLYPSTMGTTLEYQRYMAQIGFGYKIGLIRKNSVLRGY